MYPIILQFSMIQKLSPGIHHVLPQSVHEPDPFEFSVVPASLHVEKPGPL